MKDLHGNTVRTGLQRACWSMAMQQAVCLSHKDGGQVCLVKQLLTSVK